MITTDAIIYFVGTTIEDATSREPYDLAEAAIEARGAQEGSTIFEACNHVVASSLAASEHSPTAPEESLDPVKEQSPFENSREMEMYLIGANAAEADDPFPYIDGPMAGLIAKEEGWKVYSVQTFIDLDSLVPSEIAA